MVQVVNIAVVTFGAEVDIRTIRALPPHAKDRHFLAALTPHTRMVNSYKKDTMNLLEMEEQLLLYTLVHSLGCLKCGDGD